MSTRTQDLLISLLMIIAAICAVAAMAFAQTTLPTQPATQPTTLDGLLSVVPQPTQTQIRDSLTSAHIDPTTLPAVSFAPEGDITLALNATKPGATLYLKPAGAYQANVANVTGAGARIVGDNTLPAGIRINKTGMAINAANVDISGIAATGFAQLLQVNKPGIHIHDCTAASLSRFAMLDVGSDGFLIENVTGTKIGGDLFYCVGSNGVIRNVTVVSMTSPASEHCIRVEASGTHVCTNLLIDRCDLTNDSTSGKDVLAARIFQDLSASNTTFRGWIRFGQDGPPAAGTALMRATLKDCKFPGAAAGAKLPKGGTVIDVKDGVDVTIDGATFGPFADPKQSCIHVKSTSKLHYRNLMVLGTLTAPIITSDPGAVIEALP